MRSIAFGVVLAFAMLIPVTASEPPHYTFAPKPPGSLEQSQLFFPMGEGMQSQWRATASRVHMSGSAYQWYLSIYAIDYDTATYKLQYQSPRDGAPLSRVTKASGANLWFPLQDLHIVGEAQLERPAVEDLVVQSHEAGADCGTATVTVFTYDWTQRQIRPTMRVSNGCELSASVVHLSTSDELKLVGPYYGPGAPLCCPTKESAVAYVRSINGKWVQTPSYFSLSTPR